MKIINLNCISNSCIWNIYVTWRGNEYEVPEDDTIVSKHIDSVIICKLILIALLLVILQNKRNHSFISIHFRVHIFLTGVLMESCGYFARTFVMNYTGICYP